MNHFDGLVKTQWGFYQVDPKPTKDELAWYYSQKYYQEGKGSYAVNYIDDEIRHFRLKADLIYRQIKRLQNDGASKSFLDIGCGEGWTMDRFHVKGYEVKGIDFSAYALDKFHPHLNACLDQGDIYETMERYTQAGRTFDVVALLYVIEHVLDPVDLLKRLKKLLNPGGVLVILAPNDFSKFHDYILKEQFIEKPFWIVKPDHISYFNKDSMTALLGDLGYNVAAVVGNNPIDFNILNANSNYGKDPAKGKNTHYFRIRTDNFIAGIDPDKLLDVYTTLGSMGIGRDLYYYVTHAAGKTP